MYLDTYLHVLYNYRSDYINSLHIYRREICVRITLIKGSVCPMSSYHKENPHIALLAVVRQHGKSEKFESRDLLLFLERIQLI